MCMKKIFAVLLAALTLVFCLAGCTSQTPAAGTPSAPAGETPEKAEAKAQDAEIKILSSALGSDYAGDPILIVEYEFTNHTDKAVSFTFAVTDKAYQNGVECSNTVISDEIDLQQTLNDVKPETPYTLKVGYALQDTETPVEIEITDVLGAEQYLTQTIELG